MDSLSLLQQIFPTQESNQGLLHCRRILYQLIYQGSPSEIEETSIIRHLLISFKEQLCSALYDHLNTHNKMWSFNIESRLLVAKEGGGLGERWIGSLGLADANYYVWGG